MKCGALDKLDLAKAYMRAANDAGEADVTMDHLAPHLAATGSSCGACPALLPLAKKAFEGHQGEIETTADVVREAIHEVVPDLGAYIPKGG
jgi:hypothetical protein